MSQSRKSFKTPTQITDYEKDSRIVNQYYQPPPLRVHRRKHEIDHAPREIRVDLPHFHGKEVLEAYLDWELKVEQRFECHQVVEETKVSLETLSF